MITKTSDFKGPYSTNIRFYLRVLFSYPKLFTEGSNLSRLSSNLLESAASCFVQSIYREFEFSRPMIEPACDVLESVAILKNEPEISLKG